MFLVSYLFRCYSIRNLSMSPKYIGVTRVIVKQLKILSFFEFYAVNALLDNVAIIA